MGADAGDRSPAEQGSRKAVQRAVTGCRICGGGLESIIDLGVHHLSGIFPAPGEPEPLTTPLHLMKCSRCHLVQLGHTVAAHEMFTAAYGYRSGINKTMRDHLSGLSADIERALPLTEQDVVLDIGCNDGTLLKSYRTSVARHIGIDPVSKQSEDLPPDRYTIVSDYFSKDRYWGVSDRPARVVTSIAMLYDLEDPASFVGDIADILDEEGIWITEQSYLPAMLERNSFDQIAHEHLCYHTLETLERLATGQGFRIFGAELNDINGGSLRCWFCKNESRFKDTGGLHKIKDAEQGLHLDQMDVYRAFKERVLSIRSELYDTVYRINRLGKKIYLYGASTKGNTILQFCRLSQRLVRGAADRNPRKWGRRTPGTGIPIVSEQEGRAEADVFLVMPWSFRDEFLQREKEFREKGGRLIFPLPQVEIA